MGWIPAWVVNGHAVSLIASTHVHFSTPSLCSQKVTLAVQPFRFCDSSLHPSHLQNRLSINACRSSTAATAATIGATTTCTSHKTVDVDNKQGQVFVQKFRMQYSARMRPALAPCESCLSAPPGSASQCHPNSIFARSAMHLRTPSYGTRGVYLRLTI